jgi:hypothetical protein
VSDRAREVDVTMSRQLARVMDDAVTVPGTRIGLGLDALIGLVPGIGDAFGSALSSVIVRDAIRARVPMVVLARMGLNLIVDALLGLVPGLGDVLDVAHRANRKNLRLLVRRSIASRCASRRHRSTSPARWSSWRSPCWPEWPSQCSVSGSCGAG